MSKKVKFTPKPTTAPPPNADAWVSGALADSAPAEKSRAQPVAETTKRFTIDVAESLHRRIKIRCAEKGVDMNVEIRRLLNENFPQS